MPNSLAPKLVTEFIATFALVFIGAGTSAVAGNGAGLGGIAAIAFAPGLTIMVFVFAYGNVSGAHMNPAVTVGVLAAGGMSVVDAVGYIIAQVVAAIVAALALSAVLGGVATGLGTPELAHDLALNTITTVTITPAAGFTIEALLAFFLITTVLSTVGKLAPLAIGMSVTVGIMMGGPLTGAAFNPARALGPMIVTGRLEHAWLYVLAPLVGAIVAALVHLALSRLARQRTKAAVPASTPAE